MTQKEYEKMCKLINRKQSLEEIKQELSNNKYSLGYIYEAECLLLTIYAENISVSLKDFLEKHDKMIRKEIDQEIERLNKEIEAL